MLKKTIPFIICGFLFPMILWAADYSRCAQRFALSMQKVENSYGIALNENELLYYGKQAPEDFKIIKSDPFMGLYLLQATKKMTPLELKDLTDEATKGILGVGSPEGFSVGKIVSRMSGFLDYAQFSEFTPQNSVISSICYQFYGIGTGDGFIESSYIKRFLDGDNFTYGELGALFVNDSKRIFVDYVEPFIKGINLEMGDEVLEINGQIPASFKEFLQTIYSLTPNTEANFKINRNGEIIDISTAVFERTGGMLLPHHYLSALGISFSDDWTIQHISNPPTGLGFERLEVGDQILKINNVDMPQDFIQGAKLISKNSKQPIKLLVVRDGFQFFVTINKTAENEWGGLLGE